MSLTSAQRAVSGVDNNVQPTPHWSYAGEVLQDIYDQTYAVPFSGELTEQRQIWPRVSSLQIADRPCCMKVPINLALY